MSSTGTWWCSCGMIIRQRRSEDCGDWHVRIARHVWSSGCEGTPARPSTPGAAEPGPQYRVGDRVTVGRSGPGSVTEVVYSYRVRIDSGGWIVAEPRQLRTLGVW